MKNGTENAQEKRGVFVAPLDGAGTPSGTQGGGGNPPGTQGGGNPPGTPATPPAGPTAGRYVAVLLVAGPAALTCLLLGSTARVLQIPAALVHILAYGAGRTAQWLAAKVMGDAPRH